MVLDWEENRCITVTKRPFYFLKRIIRESWSLRQVNILHSVVACKQSFPGSSENSGICGSFLRWGEFRNNSRALGVDLQYGLVGRCIQKVVVTFLHGNPNPYLPFNRKTVTNNLCNSTSGIFWMERILFKFFVFILLHVVHVERLKIDISNPYLLSFLRDQALVYHMYIPPDRKGCIDHGYGAQWRGTLRLIFPQFLLKWNPTSMYSIIRVRQR